jgi:hypothetical protein
VQECPTSPMTSLLLAHAVVAPSHTVKAALREWVEELSTSSLSE